MTIREAVFEDIEAIADLYVSNWKTTYSGLLPEAYLEHLSAPDAAEKWSAFPAQPGHRIFVACEDLRFLGFGACSPDPDIPDCLYLDSLHICPDARGRGVGTGLIQRIGSYALQEGYARMSICIVRGNDRARALYTRLGAVHHAFFTDDFGGALSSSEKLLWPELSVFQQTASAVF